MAKGKTIWQMLTGKTDTPVEMQLENPLKLKLGTSVQIDELDFRQLNFNFKRLLEYKRTIGVEEHVFADYELLARPHKGEDVTVRLRLVPLSNPDKASGLTHNVVMLKLYWELSYDEALHTTLKDSGKTKVFEIIENGVVTEKYFRINDVSDPYKPIIKVASDDQKVESVEDLAKLHVEYWDFWREIKDEAGQPYKQYLFIEMDTDTGWFQMWRGSEIDGQQVNVL